MRRAQWITCLWPGLSRLWWRGEWSGLLAALSFALLVDFAVLSSFIWPQWMGSLPPLAAWLAIGTIWSVSIYRALFAANQMKSVAASEVAASEVAASEPTEHVDLFVQAQAEYLKGHWVEAETLLKRLLSQSPRDLEALLLLATMWRRLKRCGDANRELQRLERIEGSQRWAHEIRRERSLLQRVDATDPEGRAADAAAA